MHIKASQFFFLVEADLLFGKWDYENFNFLSFPSSEESFVVMDYATLENVEVEVGQDPEGRMSPPAKNSNYLSFRLVMSRNSEGRAEQICLAAESR